MSRTVNSTVDSEQARAFLVSQFDPASSEVEQIGEGAWSRCFGFRRGGQELAIRFGRHVDDFEKDRLAAAYRAPDLPIPEVLALGEAFDGYYAISTRVYGTPLENAGVQQWMALLPSLTDALEAIRMADISKTAGFGGWGSDGNALQAHWSDHLLTVGNDTPDRRTYGWRERLATFPKGDTAFTWGVERLKQVVTDSVPRCLIHSDLINRNVLVDGTKITGVFDWGCACYGDHLYDLAWFEFWAPWSPELDIPALRSELEHRWDTTGYVVKQKEDRLAACYLHIGLDHLAYNAYLGDWETLAATADRMYALVRG